MLVVHRASIGTVWAIEPVERRLPIGRAVSVARDGVGVIAAVSDIFLARLVARISEHSLRIQAALFADALRGTLIELIAQLLETRNRRRIGFARADFEGRSLLARQIGVDDFETSIEATVDDRVGCSNGRRGEHEDERNDDCGKLRRNYAYDLHDTVLRAHFTSPVPAHVQQTRIDWILLPVFDFDRGHEHEVQRTEAALVE